MSFSTGLDPNLRVPLLSSSSSHPRIDTPRNNPVPSPQFLSGIPTTDDACTFCVESSRPLRIPEKFWRGRSLRWFRQLRRFLFTWPFVCPFRVPVREFQQRAGYRRSSTSGRRVRSCAISSKKYGSRFGACSLAPIQSSRGATPLSHP